IYNTSGTLAADVTWSFTTTAAPTGAPTVKANTYVPAVNATGVSVSSGSITVDFEGTGLSRDTSKAITLKKDGTTTEVTTTKEFSATNNRLTISYTATLENSTKYNVSIDNEAIKNSTGPLATDVTWSFTTVASSTIPQVKNLDVDEDTFNPDDNEEVEVSFKIDKKAYLSAYIKDEDARIVRKFEDEFDPDDLYDVDDYSFDWDGEDDDGDTVDDGDYKIYVKAKAQTGNDADIESIEVTVDTDGRTGGNDITDIFDDLDDIDDDELLDAIAYVYDNDIFDGYSNDTFRPEKKINRAEMVKVLVEAFNVKSKSYNLRFTDIDDDSWYIEYLETAVANDIVSGDSGKRTFRPADSINRVEALKMVFETLGVTDDFDIDSCDDSPYSDADEDEWYIDYVCLSDDYDLFDLVGSKFKPSQDVTRGEMALVFFRLSEEGVID
ncbi:MAG: S-layer homology domain-containing protein, partial [Candidatus Gracilibacteria bacterium]